MMPVRAKVELSYKINMGNYETMMVDFGLEADALEGENATQAFDRIEEFVSARLFGKVEAIKKAL